MKKFPHISEAEYRTAKGLNKSLLFPFMRSPRHYLHALENPIKPTADMKLGTALHAELLLDQPKDAYAVMRKVDRRKTDDKAYAAQFEAENANKTVIDEEQAEDLKHMRQAVLNHAAASKLLKSCTHREQPLFAQYTSKAHEHEILLKGMVDGLDADHGNFIEIKSTEDASPQAFSRKVRSLRYDIQQLHYTYLAAKNGVAVNSFTFIVVENSAPYGVACYTLNADGLRKAYDEWVLALDFFAKCDKRENFDVGYPEEISEINF